MKLSEKLEKMADLPVKGVIDESGFKKGQRVEHKGLGGKAFFVRDLGNDMIEIEREKDLKKFKVKVSDWKISKQEKKKMKIGGTHSGY